MLRQLRWSHLVVACLIGGAVAPALRAQEFLGLQFHGFGGWYYGRSSDLQFIGAEKGGNAETAQFAINVAARPTDKLKLQSQINFQEQVGGSKVQLDYAFVEFDVASQMKIRAGRVKHPWGIYGEIYDVGTARPFQHLSQAMYGPTGFTAKAYNGVGVTGSLGDSSRWGVQYDVYGGEIDAEYEETGLFALLDPVAPASVPPTKYVLRSLNKDVVGARIQLNTPVEGLWVGASGYTGKVNLTGLKENRARATAASLEYQTERFLLRTEAGKIKLATEVDEHAGYAELAYKITPKWQIAARYDDMHRKLGSFEGVPMPAFINYRFDVDHSEAVVGINYWVNPNVVLRASYSKVEGPALLYPSTTELVTYVYTGMRPKDETNVLLLGTHFSF